MINHVGSPLAATVALVAAGLGACAAALEPGAHPLAAAVGPDDVMAWTKTICNAVFFVVNTAVGCYHLVTIGHAKAARRKAARHRNTPSRGRAPHTDPGEGANPGKG